MTTPFQSIRKGFTLIELSLAIMVTMAIGAMILALFNQQLAFLRMFRDQNFLIDEAPIISMHVSKLVGKAERFSLHPTVADAMGRTNSRLTASPVLVMYFRQPNGGPELRSILEFRAADRRLYYSVVQGNVTPDPQWSVTQRAANVQFTIEQGLLRMQLTGPQNERITYSGSMQQ